jgi:putative transposase
MAEYRKGPHTVYDVQYHLVWVTKYRYRILTGEVGLRVRDLIRQICMTREVAILKGHVGADHVHLLVSAPPHIAASKLVQSLKGKSSRLLQQEYPTLRKRYWGRHLWARGYFCATVGAVTDKMVKAYIDQQTKAPSEDSFRVQGQK